MSYPYTPPPSAPYPPPPGRPYGGPPIEPYRRPLARAAGPRVIGILALVFAPIGLFISLAMCFGPKSDLEMMELTQGDLGFFGSWLDIYLVLAAGLFILHLVAGILIVSYKRSGPPLITAYAIGAIALAVLDIAISLSLSVPANGAEYWSTASMYEELAYPRLVIEAVALPWPIVALFLANTRRSKQACGRYSEG